MKIGYIYEFEAFPPKGGNLRHAYELTQGFIQAGNQVCVLDDPTMPNAKSFDSKSCLDAFLNEIDILYIRIDGRSVNESWIIRTAMVKSKVPIVWEVNAPGDEGLAFSWLGNKKSDAPESHFRILRRRIHALRQLPGIWAEERCRRALVSRVSASICVSDSLANYVRQQLQGRNVHTIPNGGPLISEEEIKTRRQKRSNMKFTVLYSGSAIYPWQGIHFIVDTIKLALSKKLDIRFVLAVTKRTNLLPSGKNVEIVEGASREKILDLICQADVCLALYPNYTWTKWGLHNSPMKLYEYMGCMAATITSNLGQMKKDFVHEKSTLLTDNQPEEILKNILKIKENDKIKYTISRSGWRIVQEQRNWQNNSKSTLEIFERLIVT